MDFDNNIKQKRNFKNLALKLINLYIWKEFQSSNTLLHWWFQNLFYWLPGINPMAEFPKDDGTIYTFSRPKFIPVFTEIMTLAHLEDKK